jgi:hypothetical protein
MTDNENKKGYELEDHPGNVRGVFSDLDLRAVNNYYPTI